MNGQNIQDTICALSSPPGTGAIAVIRVSGNLAFSVCSRLFRSDKRKINLADFPSHTIHYGVIGKGEDLIDEVLISLFKAPRSYTGEDVIEISCHGSLFIQQKILSLLMEEGIRQARPGEFTLRAFLNGKFDLSQAEAVADLIHAQSQSSHDLALRQMRGGYSEKIKNLRLRLIHFISLIELELDFSEEQLEFADRSEFLELLNALKSELSSLIQSFSLGNVIKNGIPVAIIGKPNVGKSTLLNAILNEEKAIVSDLPGTTRDSIEDTIVIGGYSFRFIDTAGLRAAEDKIETMGIERTWQKVSEASILLFVFDATTDSFEDVKSDLSGFMDLPENREKKIILIGNKTDKLNELPKGFKNFMDYETLFVSAKRKENIHLIAESLQTTLKLSGLGELTIVSNTRHYESLLSTEKAIDAIMEGVQSGLSPDLLTVEMRTALYHIGEITGEITTEEILGSIFNRFCIGK